MAKKKADRQLEPERDSQPKKLSRKKYEQALDELQQELVKLQFWVRRTEAKVCVLFEGRDAAGKGGAIKRITEHTNPRVVKVVALPAPTEREQTQWYFQRYAPHLPAGGEIVLFDRSWYNRSGVERVMGFCNETQVEEFFETVPNFEHALIRSGIHLVKYWFSISDEEQERRFIARNLDPVKRWKLSPMDVEARNRWVDYSRAKDDMLLRTNSGESPWFVVNADDKRRARLNCIHHLLSRIPYDDKLRDKLDLPPRTPQEEYVRPPIAGQNWVPEVY